MSIKLPEPMASYIHAANAGDPAAGSICFSDQATVLDEGKTFEGRKAIREWMENSRKKYTFTSTPVKITQKGDRGQLTCEVAGSFPGSPVILDYHFQLRENLIQDLRITLSLIESIDLSADSSMGRV